MLIYDINEINKFQGKYAFLSNFYKAKFIYKWGNWQTVEHAYQALKAKDPSLGNWIKNALSPGEAKRRGCKVKMKDDFESTKNKIMFELVRCKFKQNLDLAQKLKNTSPNKLVEGNYWHDNYWGDCYCDRCIDKPGKNKLGKILTKIRSELLLDNF